MFIRDHNVCPTTVDLYVSWLALLPTVCKFAENFVHKCVGTFVLKDLSLSVSRIFVCDFFSLIAFVELWS